MTFKPTASRIWALSILLVLPPAFGILAGHDVSALAQSPIFSGRSSEVVIDESILDALVDEPCHHFEAALHELTAGRPAATAEHLRTASAYLRLESARAIVPSKAALDASVRELQVLAAQVERGQIRAEESLRQAFARAHFALADHHCVRSAHCCCQPGASEQPTIMSQASRELGAAATHLQQGLQWQRGKLDDSSRSAIAAAQNAARRMLQEQKMSGGEAMQSVRNLHKRLEGLTGRKIMLAPPVVDKSELAPSIFD